MSKSWMVRAERDGRLFDAFKDKSAVAIGWNEVGDLSAVKTRKAMADLVSGAWPETKPQSVAIAAGQLHRFVNEIEVGDMVVTYNPSRRVYLVGEIVGPYRYDKSIDPEDAQVRSVSWSGEGQPRSPVRRKPQHSGSNLDAVPHIERSCRRAAEGDDIGAACEARFAVDSNRCGRGRPIQVDGESCS